MKVGITGHQRLKEPLHWNRVRQEMRRILAHVPKPLIGITSLAIGADQLFAEIVLQQSGTFEAIIPFERYELKFAEGDQRKKYQHFLNKASRIEILHKAASEEQAYFEAGKRVVDLADLVLAVWDGRPSLGLGGTADVVTYAQHKVKQLIHLDPNAMK